MPVALSTTNTFYIYGVNFSGNLGGGNYDFMWRGQADVNLLIVDASTDRIGVGVATPLHKLDIDQTSSTAAIAALKLRQQDVDEPFIVYKGTAASADLTRSLVDEGDVASAIRVGWVKVEIDDDGNQITDGDYYMPIYDISGP